MVCLYEPKYGQKTKWWYINTNSFAIYIKTEDISADYSKDVKKGLIFQNY